MGNPLDLRGPWKICVRKVVDRSISLHGDPFRSEGTPEDMCKKSCGYEHLPPWGTPLDLRGRQKICVRKAVDTTISLHGDPFRSDRPWKICVRKTVNTSISLHGDPFTSEGNLEDMCKKGCGYEHLSPWGPFRSEGTPEDMCKKGCGYEHLPPWGPL